MFDESNGASLPIIADMIDPEILGLEGWVWGAAKEFDEGFHITRTSNSADGVLWVLKYEGENKLVFYDYEPKPEGEIVYKSLHKLVSRSFPDVSEVDCAYYAGLWRGKQDSA